MHTFVSLTAVRRPPRGMRSIPGTESPKSLRDFWGPVRAVVAIGMFDGVHVGHQRLIRTAVRLAARLRGTSVVITFHPDPQRILRPASAPPSLMPLDERLRLIEALGVDAAWVIPFTRRFSQWSAAAFAEGVLWERLRATAVVVGSNFSFGKDRGGRIAFLRRFGARHGMRVIVVRPVRRNGAAVSSSRIRALVQRGDVATARRLLGRPFALCGTVVRGAGRGRRLGFPTANLSTRTDVMPANGVYQVRVGLDGQWRPAVMNLGVRPTFRSASVSTKAAARPTCEVYVPGFRGSLYGRRLRVELLARLRPERRFASPAALVRQIRRDLRLAGLKTS